MAMLKFCISFEANSVGLLSKVYARLSARWADNRA
jgi:hypothetical protein